MLKKIDDMNYYELLEVSPRATAQEIHRAYERIRKIYDPNSIALYSLFSPEEIEKIRLRIEDAYRTLIYEENRRAYDRTLRAFPDAAEPAPQEPRYRDGAAIVAPPPPPRRQAPSAVPPQAAPQAPGFTERRSEPQPVAAAPVLPSTPQPVPPGIAECSGPVLKMLREQRGLTVRSVADTTKLSARYIEGIEAESFEKLPARPYLRGFLFSYARSICYEPNRIVTDYMKRYDAAMALKK